jgi:hypothetical protein
MLHYGIDRTDRKGLFYAAPGAAAGKLMMIDKTGRTLRGQLAANIEAAVIWHRPRRHRPVREEPLRPRK